ncbi:hypothetical protein GCM10020219_076380 [Nonomuraea dietziae]
MRTARRRSASAGGSRSATPTRWGQIDGAHQDRLAKAWPSAGVAVATAAVYSFPVPPVREAAREAGVTVACGHDGIRDLWGPYGSGDMLGAGDAPGSYRSTFRADADIELALGGGHLWRSPGAELPGYGLSVGDQADLVWSSPWAAPPRRWSPIRRAHW